MYANTDRMKWNEWHGRGRGSAKAWSPEADVVGSRGHLHAKFTWIVSIIVNFPSEVIARKRLWRTESHFSQERERVHACALSNPVSIRTRNASRATINQNLDDSRPRRLWIYAVYDAPEGNRLAQV